MVRKNVARKKRKTRRLRASLKRKARRKQLRKSGTARVKGGKGRSRRGK